MRMRRGGPWRIVSGDGLLVLVLGALGTLLATQVGRMMDTDGWLALVVGRLIDEHGLPSRNGLTVLGHGKDWVDQQWLAQLLVYESQRVGGLGLVVASTSSA